MLNKGANTFKYVGLALPIPTHNHIYAGIKAKEVKLMIRFEIAD